jgi:hypothetical protein
MCLFCNLKERYEIHMRNVAKQILVAEKSTILEMGIEAERKKINEILDVLFSEMKAEITKVHSNPIAIMEALTCSIKGKQDVQSL